MRVHRTRDADATDGQPRQTCGDIDVVAEQIAVALDHAADGDSDAKGHKPIKTKFSARHEVTSAGFS